MFAIFAYAYEHDSIVFESVYWWSGYLLSLVLGMWAYCCDESWFEDDYEGRLLISVITIFVSLLFWPTLLLFSVFSLLIHYFRSFIEKEVLFSYTLLVPFSSVITLIIEFIKEFA